MACLIPLITSCDEIAKQLGYTPTSLSTSPSETSTKKEAENKQRIKENIAGHVHLIWDKSNGSYCIQNDTDYTLDKVSVATAWTQYNDKYQKIPFQSSRNFTYIPAHSKSISIEYDKYRMNDMTGQIYEIKCSALGL